jgi:hypothetical protein
VALAAAAAALDSAVVVVVSNPFPKDLVPKLRPKPGFPTATFTQRNVLTICGIQAVEVTNREILARQQLF